MVTALVTVEFTASDMWGRTPEPPLWQPQTVESRRRRGDQRATAITRNQGYLACMRRTYGHIGNDASPFLLFIRSSGSGPTGPEKPEKRGFVSMYIAATPR
jgi:hypothetical protein